MEFLYLANTLFPWQKRSGCVNQSLKSGVPVCLVKQENLPYFYFDGRFRKKTLYTLKDSHQHILLAKFHENMTLPILGADSKVYIEFYCHSKDMAEFHVLQDKLEPLTLKCCFLGDRKSTVANYQEKINKFVTKVLAYIFYWTGECATQMFIFKIISRT